MSLVDQLQTAKGRAAEIIDEMEALGQAAQDEGRDLSDEDQGIIDKLSLEADTINKSIDSLTSAIQVKEKITARRITPEMLDGNEPAAIAQPKSREMALPAAARYQKSKYFDSTYDAYMCGQWIIGCLGNAQAKEFCRNRGMTFRNAMEGGTPSLGGYAVPDPMAATIIRLVEEYGVYRNYSRNVAMTSDTLDVPKRAGGTTVYFPAEGEAITPSDLTFAQVNLVAKKYAQLTIMSTELNEDAVISMVDLITQEFAWNFAFSEDKNSFLGDGTGTYAGITGIVNALQAGSKRVLGAGNTTPVDIVKADLEALVGLLPQYSGINPRWFMHSSVYHTVCVPAMTGLGGTDMRQFEQGGEMMLLGYPVTFAQVLPKASDAGPSVMPIIIGDLNLGSYIGTRRMVTIRQLNELYAANDQIGIVGTLRSDSVIHDVGDATDPGCIVGIETSAT